MSVSLVRRILARLEAAELHESNAHFQDDYRIAWITVLNASTGVREPHVVATYRVLGIHPEKVFASIEARRRWMLGADYEQFHGSFPFSAGSSPNKPVQSERRKTPRDRAA